jgi:hypothetical protein
MRARFHHGHDNKKIAIAIIFDEELAIILNSREVNRIGGIFALFKHQSTIL